MLIMRFILLIILSPFIFSSNQVLSQSDYINAKTIVIDLPDNYRLTNPYRKIRGDVTIASGKKITIWTDSVKCRGEVIIEDSTILIDGQTINIEDIVNIRHSRMQDKIRGIIMIVAGTAISAILLGYWAKTILVAAVPIMIGEAVYGVIYMKGQKYKSRKGCEFRIE